VVVKLTIILDIASEKRGERASVEEMAWTKITSQSIMRIRHAVSKSRLPRRLTYYSNHVAEIYRGPHILSTSTLWSNEMGRCSYEIKGR
jgi:hypothetical protein